MVDFYGDYPNEIFQLSEQERANFWIIDGETGVSSKTIWAVMRGVHQYQGHTFRFTTPRDPSDFRRCYLLLKLLPEWRERLSEVGDAFPEWKPLVEHWDELTALFEAERQNPNREAPLLYKRMQELRQ